MFVILGLTRFLVAGDLGVHYQLIWRIRLTCKYNSEGRQSRSGTSTHSPLSWGERVPKRWCISNVEQYQMDVVGFLQRGLGIFLSLYLFEVNWAPYVRETVQWYAIASEMRFGKVYDGRGLSVCRRVRLIEVTVVVYGD